MTYTHEGTKDWYPAQGYRNRDQGNLVGLATTRTGHYWSNYRSGRTISHFYISKRLSTGKLLQPQSTDKSGGRTDGRGKSGCDGAGRERLRCYDAMTLR